MKSMLARCKTSDLDCHSSRTCTTNGMIPGDHVYFSIQQNHGREKDFTVMISLLATKFPLSGRL
jgi:hypothetical protein